MPFIPSPQQKAVFNWVLAGQGNAFVEAVAGSGKTTTLVEACKRMTGSIVFTAFNKKIADEIKVRTLGLNNVRAGTFHSFGYGAWRRVYPECRVDEREKRDQMLDYLDPPQNLRSLVCTLVSLAKQSAVEKLWPIEDMEEWAWFIDHHDLLWNVETSDEEADVARAIMLAQKGVVWSRAVAQELIDFDDMIWLPATSDVKMYQNDWVLVDEAQDTNPARRILARKMMNPRRGRIIWVGDRHQAIYGFTGADADAIDQIMEDFQCKAFPLTVTYRCPKAVVTVAQRYVSHIEAHESAPDGLVRDVGRADFLATDMLTLVPGDAILCRKTAPLVSLAFKLIRRSIPAHVEGREIGQGLMKLVTKWKKITTVEQLVDRLDAFAEKEVERLTRKKQEGRIEGLMDRIETIKVLADGCALITEVADKIATIFQDTRPDGQPTTVILSTVHKAKGREWKRVYVLGFNEYMPSKMARQGWQMQQETNIIYVAVTRSMWELVLLAALEDQTPVKHAPTPRRRKR